MDKSAFWVAIGATVLIVCLMAWAVATFGCSRFTIDPIAPAIDLMVMQAAGEELMIELKQKSPEWAVAVRNYVGQTLLPKLDDPATGSTIGLKDEIIWGLNLLADEIQINEETREAIKWAIRLMTGIMQPGVIVSEHEKTLLSAFGEGLLAGYQHGGSP